MEIRSDWDEWKDLLFLKYLSHAEYTALAQGEDTFNGFSDPGCNCGGWRRYHKTDSGHREECPLHEDTLRAMKANPR